MSTFMPPSVMPPVIGRELPALPYEADRGKHAMLLVIATETFLFISLFFSYFYLAQNKGRWQHNEPPKLMLALIMLVVLFASSVVLHWGEKQVKKGNTAAGRIALIGTLLLGIAFFIIQIYEYIDHWHSLTPFTDAYGSIFYTITSFHALHLIVGLLILAYVLVLPHYRPTDESPYLPYEVASMYWHFVDLIWFFIVGILYIGPHL